MRRIGVLGGMMDPIHMGHLRAAAAALGAGMDGVLLAPSRIPPHRPQPAVSFPDRLAMCRLAAEADDRLKAVALETAAGYAIEEARAVKKMYPDAKICWIIGAACYFHITHLLIPDVDYGVVRCLRPFNALAVALSVFAMLEMTALAWDQQVLLYISGIGLCVVTLLLVPVMDRGVKKWLTT